MKHGGRYCCGILLKDFLRQEGRVGTIISRLKASALRYNIWEIEIPTFSLKKKPPLQENKTPELKPASCHASKLKALKGSQFEGR